MWKLVATKFMYISSWQYRTSQIIFVFIRSQPPNKPKTIYIIEVMELFTIISYTQNHVYVQRKTFQLQTHKQQNLNKTRYCERLMHHCLFDVFWLQRLFFSRLWHTRYTMVRGHICMLQRNRDIYYYYYDYYFQYNTQLKLITCKPKLRELNFETLLILKYTKNEIRK